ncbi:hypothetical protein LXA43DRAFT_1054748 [Ganoderma leucocontextum]|nr:hypothetical protein LXA43DRAFT_1054748 [Ganoderma leucocontextum]
MPGVYLSMGVFCSSRLWPKSRRAAAPRLRGLTAASLGHRHITRVAPIHVAHRKPMTVSLLLRNSTSTVLCGAERSDIKCCPRSETKIEVDSPAANCWTARWASFCCGIMFRFEAGQRLDCASWGIYRPGLYNQCSHHSIVVSQRQSEFIDDLWSGRLTEPYLAARVSRISNSHALCHSSSGPSFSRGPSGATYGYAVLNATFSSEAAAAYGEEVPSLSARYRRARKAGATIKLEIVVTDVETAKRVDVKSPKLFSGTDRECLVLRASRTSMLRLYVELVLAPIKLNAIHRDFYGLFGPA